VSGHPFVLVLADPVFAPFVTGDATSADWL
jgi:hypothetical protein